MKFFDQFFDPKFFWYRIGLYVLMIWGTLKAQDSCIRSHQEHVIKSLGTSKVRVVDIRVDRTGHGKMVVEPDVEDGYKGRIIVWPEQNIPKVGETWRIGPGSYIGSLSFIERIQGR